jgi:glycosyltransferase involved in cell wall biosynthesis
MSELTVSIIVPAFNESAVITQCLRAAVNQKVEPLEVIVVDNMSTDNTQKLVEKFAQEYQRAGGKVNIRLIQASAKQGLIYARNTGFDAATGDILGRIDADTLIAPGWTEAVIELYARNPQAMGATGPVSYYDMPLRRFSLHGDDKMRQFLQLMSKKGSTILFGANMSIRSKAWRAIGREFCLDNDDKFHEDVDITIHLNMHDFEILYAPKMIAGVSARRLRCPRAEFGEYQNRWTNTVRYHNANLKSAKFAKALIWSLYFPMHALMAIYIKRYQKIQAECELDLWGADGPMSPFHHRVWLKLKKSKEQ